MLPIRPKIAVGRDSESFEHGPGRVLRVARDGRSLVAEAEIMRHAPLHGPTMMETLGKPLFPLRRSGTLLASCTSACTGSRRHRQPRRCRCPAIAWCTATCTRST